MSNSFLNPHIVEKNQSYLLEIQQRSISTILRIYQFANDDCKKMHMYEYELSSMDSLPDIKTQYPTVDLLIYHLKKQPVLEQALQKKYRVKKCVSKQSNYQQIYIVEILSLNKSNKDKKIGEIQLYRKQRLSNDELVGLGKYCFEFNSNENIIRRKNFFIDDSTQILKMIYLLSQQVMVISQTIAQNQHKQLANHIKVKQQQKKQERAQQKIQQNIQLRNEEIVLQTIEQPKKQLKVQPLKDFKGSSSDPLHYIFDALQTLQQTLTKTHQKTLRKIEQNRQKLMAYIDDTKAELNSKILADNYQVKIVNQKYVEIPQKEEEEEGRLVEDETRKRIGLIQPGETGMIVVAQVLDVGNRQYKKKDDQRGFRQFTPCKLADQTGCVNAFLPTSINLKKGDVLKLVNCEATLFNNHIELQMSQGSLQRENKHIFPKICTSIDVSKKAWRALYA